MKTNELFTGDVPVTDTVITPDVAPTGTTTTNDVEPQAVYETTGVPLKLTVLKPCTEPKLRPVITTVSPTCPLSNVPAVLSKELIMIGVGVINLHENAVILAQLKLAIDVKDGEPSESV